MVLIYKHDETTFKQYDQNHQKQQGKVNGIV